MSEHPAQPYMTVNVIPPEYTRDEITKMDLSVVSPIYYPYLIFHMQAVFKRIGKPKTVEQVLAVDLSRKIALKADSLPLTNQHSVNQHTVIPQEIPDQLGYKMAKRKFLHILMRKMLFFIAPSFYVQEYIKAFKIYWIVKNSQQQYFLVNSLTGETEHFNPDQELENAS